MQQRAAGEKASDSSTNEQIRQPFSRQPAQCLLIDLTADITPEVVTSINEGISNFFSIVCNMKSGSGRIPYFCLLSVSPYAEVCFAMQRLTKLSYHKIEREVKEMFSSCDQRISNASSRDYERAFRDAVSQFQKIKSANSHTKLNLTIMTCQHPKSTRTNVVQALKRVAYDKFNNVDVCCFRQDLDEADSSQFGLSQFDDYEVMNTINVNVIEKETLCVESLLHNWLRDTNTDQEHLHLAFSKTSFTIKCDVEERLIDLSELPYQDNMEMSVHGFNNLSNMSVPGSIFRSSDIGGASIIHLQVLYRIDIETVCESIVFGRPYLLFSSNCWRMDWEDLEANRKRFAALCHSLFATEQCLLCENLTKAIKKPNTLDNGGAKPKGLYIVFPAQKGSSLLVKSIASRGLTLLNRIQESSEVELSTEAVQEINDQLQKVPNLNSFNPLEHDTGLVACLKTALRDGNYLMKSNTNIRTTTTPSFGHQGCPQGRTKVAPFANQHPTKNPTFVHPRSAAYKHKCDDGLKTANPTPKRPTLKTSIPGNIQNDRRSAFPKKSVTFANFSG